MTPSLRECALSVTTARHDAATIAEPRRVAYLHETSMSGSGVRKQNSGFDRAVEHHRAGRVEQAEALYRKVVEQSPQHDRALFLLGALCLASQRFEEALSFSRRAAQADAHNAHYLSNWGEALRRLGRLEEAAEVLVQAVSRRPDLPEASFNLALVLSDLGQVEEALTCLVRAADVAPERYEIQLRLAREFKRAGESNAAVAHYQTALALNPRSLEALLESSRELRRLKRSDGAVAMARRAVALVPSSAAARNASAADVTSIPRGTGSPAARNSSLARSFCLAILTPCCDVPDVDRPQNRRPYKPLPSSIICRGISSDRTGTPRCSAASSTARTSGRQVRVG